METHHDRRAEGDFSSSERGDKAGGPTRLVDLFFRPLADEIDRVRIELLDAIEQIRKMVEEEMARRGRRQR